MPNDQLSWYADRHNELSGYWEDVAKSATEAAAKHRKVAELFAAGQREAALESELEADDFDDWLGENVSGLRDAGLGVTAGLHSEGDDL